MPTWLRYLIAAGVVLAGAAAIWEIGWRLRQPWDRAACERSGGRLIPLPPEPFHESIFICEYLP